MAIKRIQEPPRKRGPRILAPPPSTDDQYPAFRFSTTAPGYGISDCSAEDRLHFFEHLRRRSEMTWAQMQQANHRGLGLERISLTAIRVPLPAWVTADQTILVLRCGDLRRMVGYRADATFCVVWMDCNGSVYDHGP